MTVPNPEHLFEQAEQLISSRQVDLRRAISSAYYAVLHAILTAAADSIVGRSARASAPYSLVYRSVNHRMLRDLCKEAQKEVLTPKFREFVPDDGFGSDMRAFAQAVCELQIRREEADYDPLRRFEKTDARLAIRSGRGALRRFNAAPDADRNAFIRLLLFRPRW